MDGRAWALETLERGKVKGMQAWSHTFLGGTMAMASLAGMEMWCGRCASFSPFMDRRNCAQMVSACAHMQHTQRRAAALLRAGVAAYLHGGQLACWTQRRRRAFAVCAHCTTSVSRAGGCKEWRAIVGTGGWRVRGDEMGRTVVRLLDGVVVGRVHGR